MPPKKRRHSLAVTPKSSKGDKKNSKTPMEDTKPVRPKVKIQRKKKVTIKVEPEIKLESLSPPPPDKKVKRKKNKKNRKPKTENFYPFDDPEGMGDLHKTVVAVQKAVSQVLDDHVVRCTVPLPMMAAACRKLRKKLADRRIEREDGSISALEATLDEIMSEFVEDDISMDKSIFIQELNKYLLIGASQLFKLNETTHLKIVQSLAKSRANLLEYESGAPPRPTRTIWEHFELSKADFDRLPEHSQWMFTRRYYDDMMKYHDEFEIFLNKKHVELQEQAKIHAQGKKARELSKNDPFKHWPEGREMEVQLANAFSKQRDLRRFIFFERGRIAALSKTMRRYWAAFRIVKLRGIIGARTEEQERTLERQFAWTPRFTLMALYDHEDEEEIGEEEHIRMKKEEEEEDRRTEEEEESRRQEDGRVGEKEMVESIGDGGSVVTPDGDDVDDETRDKGREEDGDETMEVVEETREENSEDKENEEPVEVKNGWKFTEDDVMQRLHRSLEKDKRVKREREREEAEEIENMRKKMKDEEMELKAVDLDDPTRFNAPTPAFHCRYDYF